MKKFVNGQYIDLTSSELESFRAAQANQPTRTPSELREQAYNTATVIPWGGAMLTVTEAAQQWQYYAAEGNTEKMDELTALIAAAKETIRAKYPDNAGGT